MQTMTILRRLSVVTGALLIVTQPLLTNSAVAASAAQTNCTQIEDSLERLRCFDQQFPRDKQSNPKLKPDGSDKEISAPAVITSTPVTPSQQPAKERVEENVGPVAPVTQSKPSAEAAPGKRSPSIFALKEKVNITSKISAIKAEHAKKMVFRLENGQIWLQDSPRSLPFKVGQTVTVKSGRIGGYVMHSEQGTSTRVRQIN